MPNASPPLLLLVAPCGVSSVRLCSRALHRACVPRRLVVPTRLAKRRCREPIVPGWLAQVSPPSSRYPVYTCIMAGVSLLSAAARGGKNSHRACSCAVYCGADSSMAPHNGRASSLRVRACPPCPVCSASASMGTATGCSSRLSAPAACTICSSTDSTSFRTGTVSARACHSAGRGGTTVRATARRSSVFSRFSSSVKVSMPSSRRCSPRDTVTSSNRLSMVRSMYGWKAGQTRRSPSSRLRRAARDALRRTESGLRRVAARAAKMSGLAASGIS